MPTVWDARLPQSMRPPGGWRRIDTRALWQPDTGPIHSARTSTLEPRNFDVELLMSESQFGVLEAFYDTELFGGTQVFEWTNPWPDAGNMHFFFLTPPDPIKWTSPQRVEPATSGKAVRLVTGTFNPQRIGTIAFGLQWRNP